MKLFGKQGSGSAFAQLPQRPAHFLSAPEDDECKLVAYAVRAEEIILPVEIDAKRDGTLALLFLVQAFDDRKLLSVSCSPVGVNGHQHHFPASWALTKAALS
jgi:hypothetical protein